MGMGWKIVKSGNSFKVVSYNTGANANASGEAESTDSVRHSQKSKSIKALANEELNTPDEPKQRTGGLLG